MVRRASLRETGSAAACGGLLLLFYYILSQMATENFGWYKKITACISCKGYGIIIADKKISLRPWKMKPRGAGTPRGFPCLPSFALLVEPLADVIRDHARADGQEEAPHFVHGIHLLPTYGTEKGRQNHYTRFRHSPQGKPRRKRPRRFKSDGAFKTCQKTNLTCCPRRTYRRSAPPFCWRSRTRCRTRRRP